MAVVLRTALPADLSLLEGWDDDPYVADSGGDDDVYDWEFELGRTVSWREILIAEVDGEPVGVVVLIDAAEEESHYWGFEVEPQAWAIDIWIGEARHRSRGTGSEMMRQAVRRCFVDHGASVVLIDPLAANEGAVRFYGRLGFQVVGPRRFGNDECVVMAIRPGAG